MLKKVVSWTFSRLFGSCLGMIRVLFSLLKCSFLELFSAKKFAISPVQNGSKHFLQFSLKFNDTPLASISFGIQRKPYSPDWLFPKGEFSLGTTAASNYFGPTEDTTNFGLLYFAWIDGRLDKLANLTWLTFVLVDLTLKTFKFLNLFEVFW